MQYIDVKKELSLRFIAYFEIIGGALGILTSMVALVVSIQKALYMKHVPWMTVATITCKPLFFLFLYLFLLRAGLMMSKHYLKGHHDSMWCQLLQVPTIISPWLNYHFHAGIDVSLGYFSAGALQKLDVKSTLGSHYWLQIGSAHDLSGFYINVVALLCIIILYVYRPGKQADQLPSTK